MFDCVKDMDLVIGLCFLYNIIDFEIEIGEKLIFLIVDRIVIWLKGD